MLRLNFNRAIKILPRIENKNLTNRKQGSNVRNKLFSLLGSLLLALLVFSLIPPYITSAADTVYTFDRTITWADGSTEHVQIASDGFFYLNGEKRNLLGMVLGLQELPTGEYGQFYLTSNMAMYERELAYLQSTGIRLIHFEMGYVYHFVSTLEGEQKAYKDLMDLAYKHKMLVIPEICGLNHPAFGSLQVNDFLIPVDLPDGSTDSMGKWAARWINTVSAYANVVGVVADNELDINQDSHGYTATAVASYMSFLTGILRTKYDGPILAKLAGTNNQNDLIEPEIKRACIDTTDMVGFDCYADDDAVMENQMNILQTWLGNSGYPTTGWWCLEFNCGRDYIISAYLDSGYAESLFNHGARIALMFVSNCTAAAPAQFFDNYGYPTAKLAELATDFDRLQAPIETVPVVITAPSLTLPANNSTTSNLTPTLSWSTSATGSNYSLQVSVSSTFGTTLVDNTQLSVNTFTVPNDILNWDTTYYWRVNAKDSNGNTSPWSDTYNFKSPIENPPSPSIGFSPSSFTFNATLGESNPPTQALNISNSGDGTLSWSLSESTAWLALSPTSGSNSGSSTLYVSISGLAAGTYNTNITIAAAGATNTPQTVPVTLIVNPQSPTIGFSPSSFTFNATLGESNPPTQALNISNSGDGTLSWSLSESAAWLALSPTSGSNSGSSTLSVSISGLAAGTYNTNITIAATGATNTPQTVPVTLITAPSPVLAPAAPSLTLPANNSTISNLTPTLSWNASAGASNYSLQVSDSLAFSTTLVNQTALNNTSYSIPSGVLSSNHSYFWRVSARNTSGNISQWSTIYTFNTPAPAPVVLEVPSPTSPANDTTINSLTPTLSWNASAGASNYSLQVSVSSTFETALVDNTKLSVNTFTIPSDILDWGIIYYWRISAEDANGNISQWSTTNTFTTTTGVGIGSLVVTNRGSGYTTPPTVTITGGDGSGATATAILGKSVSAINVTNGGTGYYAAPRVIIYGGGGTGAKAIANIKAVGAKVSVVSVTVTNGGQGYTSTPTVSFAGAGGSGATATCTMSAGKVASLTLTNPGAGYISAPTVTISGGGGSGATAVAILAGSTTTVKVIEPVETRSVASITVTKGGTGYYSAPRVIISGGGGTGATAVANIKASGPKVFVASVTVTNGGQGYVSAPTVTFAGGGGSGTTATATLTK